MNWELSRNDTGAVIGFDQDMLWPDEFTWSGIAQTQPVYTLSGAVLVQQGMKLAGRPITLSADWVWHTRETVVALQEWSYVPGLKMLLKHYDGRQFNVCFRYHDGSMTNVEPVRYSTPEQGSDKYTLSLQLMTV